MEPDSIDGPEVSYPNEDDDHDYDDDDYEDAEDEDDEEDEDDRWRDDPRAVAQHEKLPELIRRLATVTPQQWHTICRRRSTAFPSDLDVSISMGEWANDPRNDPINIEDEILAAQHATYDARDPIVGSSDRFTASAAVTKAVFAIAHAHHCVRWQTEQLLAPFEEIGLHLCDLIPHDAPTTPPRPQAPYVDPATQYGPRTPQIRLIAERLNNLTDQQWRTLATRQLHIEAERSPLTRAARESKFVLRQVAEPERDAVNSAIQLVFRPLEDHKRPIFDDSRHYLAATRAADYAIASIAVADRNPAWITHAVLQALTDTGIPIDDLIPDNTPTTPAPPTP